MTTFTLASFWSRHARKILGLALLMLAVHDIFGAHGFLAMRRTQRQIQQLREEIERLNKENNALSERVQSLRTDPKAVERIAREVLTNPVIEGFRFQIIEDGAVNAADTPADPISEKAGAAAPAKTARQGP